MTGMLASINSVDEAQLILNTSVDIIDLKQPKQGALGALSIATVKDIVLLVDNIKPVSATVGDIPMQPEMVFNAVVAMAGTGVDYIKIGFFPGGDWKKTLFKLSSITQQGQKLIAVLFADTQFDINTIALLKTSGFSGVMLDTMNKSNGSLTQVMTLAEINKFVTAAKDAGLMCGLAGSLKANDIPVLKNLKPDYLGFRGALCIKNKRTASISNHAISSILNYFE